MSANQEIVWGEIQNKERADILLLLALISFFITLAFLGYEPTSTVNTLGFLAEFALLNLCIVIYLNRRNRVRTMVALFV